MIIYNRKLNYLIVPAIAKHLALLRELVRLIESRVIACPLCILLAVRLNSKYLRYAVILMFFYLSLFCHPFLFFQKCLRELGFRILQVNAVASFRKNLQTFILFLNFNIFFLSYKKKK